MSSKVEAILHSYQKGMIVPFIPYPYQHLVLSVILAILVGIVVSLFFYVFKFHFPMTYDIERLFICFFAICIFSLVSCLLRSLSHFSIELSNPIR